jgi:CRISPR-associated Csh1 family protein
MKPYFEIAAAPYPERDIEQVVVVAEIIDKRFQKLSIDTYRKSYIPKYLFRELASSNSTGIVPTMHFYRDDESKGGKSGLSKLSEGCVKLLSKLERCIESNLCLYAQYFDPVYLLKELESKFEAFVISNLSERKNYLFTLKINDKWLGEIPEIAAVLERAAYDKYFQDSKGVQFIGRDKTCAVTYQKNCAEVWGRIATLGFTVDTISFSRNGFNTRDSYKMFPVSPAAVKILEGTKRALDKELSFRFSTLQFIVLPHFVSVENDVLNGKNLTRKFVQAVKSPATDGFDSVLNSIFSSESIFSKIMEDNILGCNDVYYDIFFYEQNQAQFAIKLHVSDVVPSRFRIIRDVKRRITNTYGPLTLKKYKSKEQKIFSPSFFEILGFFSITKEKSTIIQPYFFKVLEAVFHKNRLDEDQIIRAFMRKIVIAFKNTSTDAFGFSNQVKHSFCIHQFFQQLQLFGNMESLNERQLDNLQYSHEFISQHEDFFKNRLQKAAFLLGCAVEVLLNSQRSNLNGNEPFSKRLNNLSIDYNQLQRIKTELLSKVKQYADAKKLYNSEYIQRMLVEFDTLMLSGDDALLSKNQISYAFSVGLVMEKEFTRNRMEEIKAKKAAAAQREEE